MRTPLGGWRRSLSFFLALPVLAAACARDTPAIGDGYARAPVPVARDVAADVIDADPRMPVRIKLWELPEDLTVTREVAQAARFAADPNVLVVVGHAGSRASLLAAATYNELGVPHIVPTATAARLREAGQWTFALAPSNYEQARMLVSYAADTLHATRVSVLFVGDPYGTDLRDGIVTALAARALEPSALSLITGGECIDGDERAARALAAAHLQRAPSDVVVVVASGIPAYCLARMLVAMDSTVHILFSDSVEPSLVDIAAWSPAVRHRMHYVSLWTAGEGPLDSLFMQRITTRLGHRATPASAFEYDAFVLAATAIREGGATRDGVRRWLASLGNTRPPFEGVTGTIHFNGDRRHRMRMHSFARPESR